MADSEAAKFRSLCTVHGFGPRQVMPHGTYLTNAGARNPALREKTLKALVDECARTRELGLDLYNFHPGSAADCLGGGSRAPATGSGPAATLSPARAEACANVAAAIDHVHAAVPGVTLVIETMAGGGSVLCSTFEEVAAVIAGVADKARVGVCIDTAHVHAAGYDVRSPAGYEAMMSTFDAVVGLGYLRGLHLNDSAAALGSGKDRHWHIGRGAVGARAFQCIMSDPRTAGMPLILETPPAAGGGGGADAGDDGALGDGEDSCEEGAVAGAASGSGASGAAAAVAPSASTPSVPGGKAAAAQAAQLDKYAAEVALMYALQQVPLLPPPAAAGSPAATPGERASSGGSSGIEDSDNEALLQAALARMSVRDAAVIRGLPAPGSIAGPSKAAAAARGAGPAKRPRKSAAAE